MTLTMGRERGGGFLGWFKSIFSGKPAEPDWKEKMQTIIIMIRDQQDKLEQISFKMQKRAEELFQRTVEQYRKASQQNISEDEKKTLLNMARTFAEEIREIKAILRAIGFTKVSLEKVVQRLETVRDVKDFHDAIVPVMQVIRGVKQEISPIFPSIGHALDEVHRNISELAFQTKAGIESLPTGNLAPTEGEDVEKILKEAWEAASESVDKKIPEPMRVISIKGRQSEKVPQAHTTLASKPAKTVNRKPAARPVDVVVESARSKGEAKETGDDIAEEIKLPASRMSMARLEELVLDEIKLNRGRFNVDEFARKYGVSKDRVFDALQSLVRKGKIRVARR